MNNQVLLPQYAESLQQARREAFQQLRDALKSVATSIGQAVQSVWASIQQWVSRVIQAIHPILHDLHRVLRPYLPKRSKRSSRRGKVQDKRRALGLPVDGKLPGLSRKASYAIAMKRGRR